MATDVRPLIAGLVSDPAYIALCDFLQAQTDDIADEMSEAKSPHEGLRLLRTWQVSRKLVGILKTAPQDIKQVIDGEKQRNPLEPIAAWPDIDENEFFQRRSGPIAPPMVK